MEKKVQNFDFEILEKKKINPYITECKIKAFYLEDNRNGSYITPEVGIMLADSIYNAPIVGYYSEEQQDFLGHPRSFVMYQKCQTLSLLMFLYF